MLSCFENWFLFADKYGVLIHPSADKRFDKSRFSIMKSNYFQICNDELKMKVMRSRCTSNERIVNISGAAIAFGGFVSVCNN